MMIKQTYVFDLSYQQAHIFIEFLPSYQNHSANFGTKGASPLLAELAETCNKVGKNTGGTNQSLSESLVAQTIILDEQSRRIQRQLNSNVYAANFPQSPTLNEVFILQVLDTIRKLKMRFIHSRIHFKIP